MINVTERIQRDLDEIADFGYYSVATAFNTLGLAKKRIEQLQLELEWANLSDLEKLDVVMEQENDLLKKQL